MGRPSQADRDRKAVEHMILAAEAIQRFAKGGKARFLEDDMVRSAVERQFEVLGEAASRTSSDFRSLHAAVPWRTIIAFRNVLIHGYDKLDPEQVWDALGTPLKQALDALRSIDA